MRLAGEFPAILPSDRQWQPMTTPEIGQSEEAILPEAGSDAPPIIVRLEAPERPYLYLQALNTEYVLGCRVLQAG